ncbi:MAG: hypothetical protein ABWY36_00735 [Leifsonia sp.]
MSHHRLHIAYVIWIRRYLAPEIVGTVSALLGAWTAYGATGSIAAAAICGTAAETIGYYAVVVVRCVRGHAASADVRGLPSPWRRALVIVGRSVRSVVAEFGPAELVDTLLVRPFLLWVVPLALGPTPAAWLIGKLAADVVFYTVAITSFEVGRRVILPHRKAPAS